LGQQLLQIIARRLKRSIANIDFNRHILDGLGASRRIREKRLINQVKILALNGCVQNITLLLANYEDSAPTNCLFPSRAEANE
jgi:hypothetical protein